jgi:aminoacyl-histidine dipeptidase
MSSPLDGLKPEVLWKFFEVFTTIPRCSGNEAAAARFVLDRARAKNINAIQDATGNVVVRVPGSPGKESSPIVVLQSHLDMVGEKDSDSHHDFGTDPINVVRAGDWIGAQGTTLGADNGIGAAAALAFLDDAGAVHGPLELLFTISEEIGLDGAKALTTDLIKGKILINLDSEEDGALYIGCAGGVDTQVKLKIKRAKASGEGLKVNVGGLKGGHSGIDINMGRGNAIQILAWYLDRLRSEVDFKLVDIKGGDKHNAIPREASALLLVPKGGMEKAAAVREAATADLNAMFGTTDPGLTLDLTKTSTKRGALTRKDRDRFINLVLSMPHGVLAMSQSIPGLVESSTNLAVVRLDKASGLLHESSRSSVMPALLRIQASIVALAHGHGAETIDMGGYPGWQPNLDSMLLRRARKVFVNTTSKEPAVKAIHAGLECGIIGERLKGMDMISMGPQIEHPHSPSERVKIDTVERFYNVLKALVADLAG